MVGHRPRLARWQISRTERALRIPYTKIPASIRCQGANGQIARTDILLNEQPVIVIGRVGAYCRSIHAVFEPNWVTDNAIVATPKKGNDFRFLFYLLKYLRPERTSIGSAQPLVTQTGLKTLEHLKPPLPEQRAIAHILGSLNDKM